MKIKKKKRRSRGNDAQSSCQTRSPHAILEASLGEERSSGKQG